MEISGNKGEWSEVYALFKLLADKELSAGDADLNKIETLIYPIISIIRYDLSGEVHYNYADSGDIIIKSSNGELIGKIPIMKFKEEAEKLLLKIKKGKGSAFEIPDVVDFRNKIGVHSIKAPSGQKSDITIMIHDERTGVDPILSFSIKSQLGSPATLLNPGKNTNFVYELSSSLDENIISEINDMKSEAARFEKLIKHNVDLKFVAIEPSARTGDMYYCNLINIDSAMPEIMAELIKITLKYKSFKISDVVRKMTELNPLKFNLSYNHPYYETKIKRLLVDSALGMTPATMWTGKYEANGGYIVVREDGEIVCYHIYNKNEFEDYLFYNVKIDYPSRERYNYGYIYSKDGRLYIKLNCQIRFIK